MVVNMVVVGLVMLAGSIYVTMCYNTYWISSLIPKTLWDRQYFFWFYQARMVRNLHKGTHIVSSRTGAWGQTHLSPQSMFSTMTLLSPPTLTKFNNLPPKAYRCQGGQCLVAQLSTLPQHQQVWCCPDSTDWPTPGGLQVVVLHFFPQRHRPPGNESQSLILWNLRGPNDHTKKKDESAPKTNIQPSDSVCLLMTLR